MTHWLWWNLRSSSALMTPSIMEKWMGDCIPIWPQKSSIGRCTGISWTQTPETVGCTALLESTAERRGFRSIRHSPGHLTSVIPKIFYNGKLQVSVEWRLSEHQRKLKVSGWGRVWCWLHQMVYDVRSVFVPSFWRNIASLAVSAARLNASVCVSKTVGLGGWAFGLKNANIKKFKLSIWVLPEPLATGQCRTLRKSTSKSIDLTQNPPG